MCQLSTGNETVGFSHHILFRGFLLPIHYRIKQTPLSPPLYISDVEVRQPAADGGGAAGAVHAGGPRPPRLPDPRQVPRLLLCDRHARLLQAQVPEAKRRLLLVQTVRGTHSILLKLLNKNMHDVA
jgi:hypothetical protein